MSLTVLGISLHVNKGLWGAASEAVARDRSTAINPAVFDQAKHAPLGGGRVQAAVRPA